MVHDWSYSTVPKLFNFPQHQGTLFSGWWQPNTPQKRAPLAEGDIKYIYIYSGVLVYFLRVFFDSWRPIYQKKMVFSNRGWCYFNKPLLRAAFESPWDWRGRTFSDFFLNEKLTKIEAKNRVRNVTRTFHFREIHPHDLKKQGGKRFPSQFHRSNFIQNFTKNEFSTFMVI